MFRDLRNLEAAALKGKEHRGVDCSHSSCSGRVGVTSWLAERRVGML
jgi:tRNA(Phe) wybutosine-synthesizing methylase Tyw3